MISFDEFFKKDVFSDFDENFELIKEVSNIVDTDIARKVLIHILDIWENVNENAKEIWLDLIEVAGFYPYYITHVKDVSEHNISLKTQIRTAFYKSNNLEGVYFHEEQKEIEYALSKGDNIAVSAPTSFGKSMLIEEIVARKQFSNILIIQPTLALIDETRKKLQKYNDFYTVVINTKQSIGENNIFILTAERVLEFPNLPQINFFVIDEFYKISNRRNDGRIDALNVALMKVMEHKPQSLFLTPTVDSLSERFREKYNIEFYRTDYSLVNTNIIEVRTKRNKFYDNSGKKKKLFDLLLSQTEPSIVYVKSPGEAYKLANEYFEFLKEKQIELATLGNNDLLEWIDVNISPQWELRDLLYHKIGTHNGSLPRHIVTSEIELFNNKELKVLFATTSLIEGVNTAAKNMFIYSSYKGQRTKIDFFDFANIRGRAGRMNQYFTGNVYVFFEEPSQENFVIDVPSIDQEEVSDEIIVNIPDEDLRDKTRKEELFSDLDEDLQEIIKKNLVSVKGQINLYKFISSHKESLVDLVWSISPNLDQLRLVLGLGYKYLYNNNNERFINRQAGSAMAIANNPLKTVILNQENYFRDQGVEYPLKKAIDYVLEFQRKEAGFAIPKILAVVDSIQKYVFEKAGMEFGDYSIFASMLESEQVPENLQFLIDYGVPSSALKKLRLAISSDLTDNQVIKTLRDQSQFLLKRLLPYEQKLLMRAIS